jgi:hypothetical protein
MTQTPLSFLHPTEYMQLLKVAAAPENKDGPHLTDRSTLKAIGQAILTAGAGTAAGYGAGKLTGMALREFGVLDNIPPAQVAKGVAALAAATPVILKLQNHFAMEHVREAYQREREQKRQQLPRPR